VRTVLDSTTYRRRAWSMADEFGGLDTRAEILAIVSLLAQAPKVDVLRQGGTMAVVHRRRVAGR
jgi:hypothetical protein